MGLAKAFSDGREGHVFTVHRKLSPELIGGAFMPAFNNHLEDDKLAGEAEIRHKMTYLPFKPLCFGAFPLVLLPIPIDPVPMNQCNRVALYAEG